MADKVWISSGSTDWATPGNWSGGVPISNDRAFFRTAASTVSPDTNINNQDAVDLDLLHIEKDWPGNIGGIGNYLEISSDMVIHEGAGTLYYSDGSGTTDEFILNAKHTTSGQYSAVIGNGAANTYTLFNAIRGRFQVSNATVITKLVVGYSQNPASDVWVMADASLGTIVDYHQYAGYAELNAAITRGVMIGGTLKYSSGALALLDQYNGSVIFNSTSTAAEVNCHGGVFDMTQSGQAKTITLFRRFPNGRLAYDGGILHTVTVRQVGSGASTK